MVSARFPPEQAVSPRGGELRQMLNYAVADDYCDGRLHACLKGRPPNWMVACTWVSVTRGEPVQSEAECVSDDALWAR